MKKIFSFFAAMMLFVSTVSATTIYCKMDKSWWTVNENQQPAAVGIYTWDNEGAALAAWPGVRMAPVEGAEGVWAFDLDLETYHMCIFTRVNGEGEIADWGAKTSDLLIPTDGKNLFTITSEEPVWGDPGVVGVWSVYGEAAEGPAAAPATPEYPIYQVKAVYSDTYGADCNFGEWGSGTAYTQEDYGKKYVTASMGYFGLEFTGMDCSAMETLHMDVWIAADASIRIVPIHGGTEVGVTKELVGQQWNSIDIDLSEFEGVTNWSNVYQIKIDNAANLTFWLNNVYFYTTVAPTVDLEDGYYLIGRTGWTVYDIVETDVFVANMDAEGEFMLATTLFDGEHLKVVAVAENAITTWYPDGMDNEYVVDYVHAGEKTVYFRPNADGGEDWHYGVIFVPATEGANPYETWFAVGDTWDTETESYLEWDAENEKAIVHINVDKYGQWRAQVKYHGPIAEEGKCYHLGLKLKANHNIEKVTIKWQDKPENDPFLLKNEEVNLVADQEYVMDETVTATVAGGNGIMVLDFGYAHAGDVIEIYDVIIEEVECEPVEAVANTTVKAAVVKAIENGQLVIIKDGVRYNAQGAIMR